MFLQRDFRIPPENTRKKGSPPSLAPAPPQPLNEDDLQARLDRKKQEEKRFEGIQ